MSKQKKAECETSQSSTMLKRKVAETISDTTIENSTGVYNSLFEFIQHSIFYGLVEIEFQRNQSLTREIQW